jgi:hypothetical protein
LGLRPHASRAGYRQKKVGTLFLPGGGTMTDGFVNASYAFNPHWRAQFFTQYERLQLVWNPDLHLHR